MKRRKIAAANWKMNTNVAEGIKLLKEISQQQKASDVDVVLCAPHTHLYTLNQTVSDVEGIYLGAQNMSRHLKGAYTGEISVDMIKSCGTNHVVIGHSERREYFGEDDALLGLKLGIALEHQLIPIFCCGESLQIRKDGNHIDYVLNQLKISFSHFTTTQLDPLVIAYEPIWAIGTGETASPEQAQEMHQAIRSFVSDSFGEALAAKVPILYGGSVKPHNAQEIFGKPDVDGGLVGGASLDPVGFASIINSFS